MKGGTHRPVLLEAVIAAINPHANAIYVDGTFGGRALCFWGVSSFAARPAINIHDLVVSPTLRGQGIGSSLLAEVETRARSASCSRITLEVRGANHAARRLYTRHGFSGAEAEVPENVTLFCVKTL